MRRRILAWGRGHFRPFPWRCDRDPYRTLITEILLRQTNADRVLPVRKTFLQLYPNPEQLAEAAPSDVARLLEPLGFARQRSNQLVALGRKLATLGRCPRSTEGLLELPAIGPYSAAAVGCFAFGQARAAFDVNLARIIVRFFGLEVPRGELRRNRLALQLADAVVGGKDPRALNWAFLDLGALICRPVPSCSNCPLVRRCVRAAPK